MKRLWIAVTVLAVLLALILWHSHALSSFTDQVTGLLLVAEEQAESGSWARAGNLTEQAQALWETRRFLHFSTLRHMDMDQIHLGFCEVFELIERREDGEYSAANARLIAELELLTEMETLTLENIL